MQPFDVVTSPLRLENGRDAVPHPLLIEASAGSGKTWTLSHLAVRFLLEDDVTADQILLVTFTRDAASALRGRVREHLSEVVNFLASLESTSSGERTSWQQYYAVLSPDTRSSYLATGRERLGELDSLHAQTIHSFASEHLEVGERQLTDGTRQWTQACHESAAATALRSPALFAALWEETTLDKVFEFARVLYDAGLRSGEGRSPDSLRVLPSDDDAPSGEETGEHVDGVALAHFQKSIILDIVDRYESLLRQSGTTTFSELISGLDGRLGAPGADRFIAQLRQNFRVVMIDEFQDTDPTQWDIFRRLFLDAPETRLIMVGDPKQAIYGFRSGSVETFLAVRDLCRRRGVPITTLPTNFRSSPELLDGVNRFFAGADFHYDVDTPQPELAIDFSPALAQPHPQHAAPVVTLGEGTNAPFHLRVGKKDDATMLREVAQYAKLLHARGVAYSSIAVLCYSNLQCRTLQRFLTRQGVPAVTSADAHVFTSDAAFQVRLLLSALASPDRASFSEALRATWFRHGAGAGGEPGEFVYRLASDFASSGVTSLARFLQSPEVLEVVLATRDAERHATDLLHLTETLVRECRGLRSLALVLEWFDTASQRKDLDENVESRRLETESDAVRVMTVHKAKGLEFDTVLIPFLNQSFPSVEKRNGKALLRWVTTDAVVIDAGSGHPWGDTAERNDLTVASLAAEQRRLAYVALTRAERHLVVWLGLPTNTPLQGEFARLVYDRERGELEGSMLRRRSLRQVQRLFVGGGRAKSETDEAAIVGDPVGYLRDLWGAVSTVEVHALGDPVLARRLEQETSNAPAAAPVTFAARPAPFVAFEQRRWSYSHMASALKNALVGEDVVGESPAGGDDERTGASTDLDDELRVSNGVRNVFGSLAGARLGAAVHTVFERLVGVDDADVSDVVRASLTREGFTTEEIESNYRVITSTVARVLERPTGELLASRSLQSFSTRDVAKEMRFVLALGEAPKARRLAAMAEAVLAHDRDASGATPLFQDYFTRLRETPEGLNEGFLIGSLDLVVALDGRYGVIDYKTDQLPGETRPFAPEKMLASMERQHYPLQAVLYSVALHRHLRHTLRGYDPAHHLAGVGYYYVRVVGDPTAADGDGFATWRLSPDAVVAASNALGGRP